jgi:hypothetical protein
LFTDWKGDLEQVDDVCVIGIKVKIGVPFSFQSSNLMTKY